MALPILPNDVEGLKALILAERAAHAAERAAHAADRDQWQTRNARLEAIVRQLRRLQFGRKSEKLDANQLNLALEDLEAAAASIEAEHEQADGAVKARRSTERRRNRGHLPEHLPREEIVIEPDDKDCPCCGGALHVIGEDVSERLDRIPAKLKVIITRRPKYACRSCTDGVHQAPAPARLITGGLPTKAFVADVLVSKYADHLPLYRQSQILARDGIEIHRSTLAHWVGFAAFELAPLHARLLEILKASPKLFADETPCPVLDPRRGRTKKGYLWAVARDDRPWRGIGQGDGGGQEAGSGLAATGTGIDPPAVAYTYAPGRGAEHARRMLAGFTGILQVDGYGAYNKLEPAITLALCWSHFRRRFYDVAKSGNAPIATEVLRRIGELYDIESEIRGRSADERRAVRQARAKDLVDDLKGWLEEQFARVPKSSTIAEDMRYGLKRWDKLSRFLDDGRIEMDTNTVERSIRPLALNRKNALFAGSDEGGTNWAVIASLIETCKLNDVNPHAWLTDTLTKLVNHWPQSRIDDLMPWAYADEVKV